MGGGGGRVTMVGNILNQTPHMGGEAKGSISHSLVGRAVLKLGGLPC